MRKITHYLLGKINKSEPQSRSRTKAILHKAFASNNNNNNNNTGQRSFRVRQSGSQNLKYFAMKNCTNIIEKMLPSTPLCPPHLFISAAAQVKCQICIKKQQKQQRQQQKLVVYIVF